MENKVMNKTIGGLPTPVFYPSVSSVAKNTWGVIDHIELLVSFNFPQFLVSCFDIHKNKNNSDLKKALMTACDQNQILLFDSGIYEVVWSKSKRWNRRKYLKTLADNRVSHAFCFDEYVTFKNKTVQPSHISGDISKIVKQINKPIISPIIHCKSIEDYIRYCVDISKNSRPKLLAIPERELGSGMIEVAINISRIRDALNKLETYQNLHILGTGNPLSMMVYSFVGADSFDGLDWCQTVVDYETATLHHTLHFDLYAHQGRWGNEKDMGLLTKCYLHNLDFYDKWMEQLRVSIATGQKESMISKYIKGPQRDIINNLIKSMASQGDSYAVTAN